MITYAPIFSGIANFTVLPPGSYNNDGRGSPSVQSTLSAVETQLTNMFQRDFLALLGMFKYGAMGLYHNTSITRSILNGINPP